MSHHHHHHEHPLSPAEGQRGIVLSIVFNLLFVGIEAFVGLVENSLSLLSDAGHNLSDVFSLVLVLVAFRLSKIHANGRFTYGYRKSTVLISLLNAIILLVAVGAIVIESIHKFYAPAPVNGEAVSWTAAVGIVINGLTALLLLKGQRNDINVRGAFLHMAAGKGNTGPILLLSLLHQNFTATADHAHIHKHGGFRFSHIPSSVSSGFISLLSMIT